MMNSIFMLKKIIAGFGLQKTAARKLRTQNKEIQQ
jgi:hypothetical protein